MNLGKWIRQLHRWLSMAFTFGVVAYIVVMQRVTPPAWVGLFALVPLVLLLLSGLFLFVLPYTRRGARATA